MAYLLMGTNYEQLLVFLLNVNSNTIMINNANSIMFKPMSWWLLLISLACIVCYTTHTCTQLHQETMIFSSMQGLPAFLPSLAAYIHGPNGLEHSARVCVLCR